ncbi:ATP-binding cassette sub-family G member 1-like isoform X2 [Anopheles maculipalpis]|uniref:ATP-binding cassette sub-family G member 1-like isoform X2 n=1 Tax=Anopheles maculipalpis TaxID=1496333 RepID=UPI00215954D2|nr:ATP-binding cassette sub-family G member 1-like isoform X2 [Anopheles maculipalpis]
MMVAIGDPDSIPMQTLEGTSAREFDLSFRNVSYCVKHKHDRTHSVILKNLSGSFRSGRLVGIMGPSGAGKSTLLNVLSGFKKNNVTGQLMVDGQRLSERRSRKVISYTQQEVCLWSALTVEESMRYAAEFKLSPAIGPEQKSARVRELLHVLGLTACADTLTSKVSGGQAKRLSIGLELLSDPKVMLLDEPTSGLDTVAAYQVLAHVKQLAARGRVIACVIHQPNSQQLLLIDDLYVLAKGRRIYSGPTGEMVTQFARFGLECPVSHNPADYALEVASLDQEDERLKRLIMEEEKDIFEYKPPRLMVEKSVEGSYQRYALSTLQQLGVLLKRTARCTLRDSYQFKARILINIAIALITSVAFYNTGNNADRILANTAVLIINLYAIFFTSIVSAVLVYPRESACFVLESKNNWYSLRAYYLAKIVVELPTLILSSSVFFLIVYYFTAQPFEWLRIGTFALVCLMFGWISQMLGLLLGSIMSVQNSVFVSILIMVPASLFSGFFVPLRDASVLLKPLLYVSFVRYAFEGAVHAIYGFDRADLECPEVFCYFRQLKRFLEFVSMPDLAYGYDLLALLGWIVLLMGAVYFSLRRRIKQD